MTSGVPKLRQQTGGALAASSDAIPRASKDALWPQAYFSGEMDFSSLPRNSLVKSLVVRRNRWHLYQDSGADSKWRRIYDGSERLGALLSLPRT